MLIHLLLLLAGILFLWFGSELVVESAKKLAKKFNISHAVIGLTVISIGTSLPEIFTNIMSGIKSSQGIEASGIAIGTNIGSCVTQITLILGIVALIGTLHANKKTIYRDGGMVLLAIVLMFLFGLNGRISQAEGLILITGYLIYLFFVSHDDKVIQHISAEIHHMNHKEINTIHNMIFITVGIALLILGSEFVVNNALYIAHVFGLAQSFIGVMIIGVGTGLPELSTAIKGILKKAEGISLGTLIGSNITDPMFSLGIGALITGFSVEKNLLYFDIPYKFFATVIALSLLYINMKIGKEDKKEGIILITLYLIFVAVKIIFFM